MFTDTHCHIFKENYNDIQEVLINAEKNSVNRVINNGCDSSSNKEVMELINFFPNMYGAIGIHPENVLKYTPEDILFIENNLQNNKIVAIGEIGLDYHYGKEHKDEQIKLFETQLLLSEKYNIPVIIHSRDATQDTIDILKKYQVKGVIHSFSGSFEVAKEYIKMGFLLGINGVVTFKNSNLKEVLKNITLDNIVLETDSPYLTPEPFRGKQNNPSHILEIAKFISNLYNISLEELANITNSNINKVFKI